MASGAGYYGWDLSLGAVATPTGDFNSYFDAALHATEFPVTVPVNWQDTLIAANETWFGATLPQGSGALQWNIEGYGGSTIDSYIYPINQSNGCAVSADDADTPTISTDGTSLTSVAIGTANMTVSIPTPNAGVGIGVRACRVFFFLTYDHTTGGVETRRYTIVLRTFYQTRLTSPPDLTGPLLALDGNLLACNLAVGFDWTAKADPASGTSALISLSPQTGVATEKTTTAIAPGTTYGLQHEFQHACFEFMVPSAQFTPAQRLQYAGLLDVWNQQVFVGSGEPAVPISAGEYLGSFGVTGPPNGAAGFDVQIRPRVGIGPLADPFGPVGLAWTVLYATLLIWGSTQTIHLAPTGGGGGGGAGRPTLCTSMCVTEDPARRPCAAFAGSGATAGPVTLATSRDAGHKFDPYPIAPGPGFDPSLWYAGGSGAARALFADGIGGLFYAASSGDGEHGDWADPVRLPFSGTFPVAAAHPFDPHSVLLACLDAGALQIYASEDGGAGWQALGPAATGLDFSQTGRPGLCWLGGLPILVYPAAGQLVAVAGIAGGAGWTQPITVDSHGPYCGISAASHEGVCYVAAVITPTGASPATRFWTSSALGQAWQAGQGPPPVPPAEGAALWGMSHTGRLLWGTVNYSDDAVTWPGD